MERNNLSTEDPDILTDKNTSEGVTISDLKLHYRTIVVKTARYWHKTYIME